MATALAVPTLSSDDPLDYLPAAPIIRFKKGDRIYSQTDEANYLYLVNDGFVKISNMGPDGREVLIDIYRPEEFFGEQAFHPLTSVYSECALALSDVHVMQWPIEDIVALMLHLPQLALAFLKIQVRRNMVSIARIKNTSTMLLKQRLAVALLYFNGRLGDIPLTHELLSQYLGSAREMITCEMVSFRKEGMIEYSRRGLTIDAVKLRAWLGR